jgi:hypothetical protein
MELQGIIERAWEDPEFKAALLAEPRLTLERELGVTFPPDLHIFIHEEDAHTLHLILPAPPDTPD